MDDEDYDLFDHTMNCMKSLSVHTPTHRVFTALVAYGGADVTTTYASGGHLVSRTTQSKRSSS